MKKGSKILSGLGLFFLAGISPGESTTQILAAAASNSVPLQPVQVEIEPCKLPPEVEPFAGYGSAVERPCFPVFPPAERVIYVKKNAPEPLQYYVDMAEPYDEILVAAGVYDIGGRQLDKKGPATRLVIDKPLTLRSEEGPEKTVIAGGTLTRCVYLGNCARLIGFTITGGQTERLEEGSLGEELTAYSGAGVWAEPDGVLENCVVISNRALWYGGGLYGGKAYRCVFDGNWSRRSGGGASYSKLSNCLFQYNRAGRFGGGAHRCVLKNCTLAHNRAEIMGGGTAYGQAVNTVMQHNQTLLAHHNCFETEMQYCSSDPVEAGIGNIGGDPEFNNSDQGVFLLLYKSPLIDAGTNVFCAATDLLGNTRLLDGNNNRNVRIDIGAYEYIHPKADSDRDGILDIDEVRVNKETGVVKLSIN